MKKTTKEEINRSRNRKYRTLMKNDFKKFKSTFDEIIVSNKNEDISNLNTLLTRAQKNIDKSVGKKVIHRNNGSRKKSRLFKMLNSVKKNIKINSDLSD